jgi:hydroxypyruvate reductase
MSICSAPSSFATLGADARAVFRAAVRGVRADALLADLDAHAFAPAPLAAYRRVVVLGLGKGALAMGGVAERALAEATPEGCVTGAVVILEGHAASLPEDLPRPERLAVLEGGHPVPTDGSVRGAERLLRLAVEATADDLVVVLVSGGGTALVAAPVEGLSLADVRATFRLLLESGADIHAMNAVRKHLLRVGGGGLARAAAPAPVRALVVSDVVGNDLATIASGPTVPDPTTFADAVRVLREAGAWSAAPAAVRDHLRAGADGERPETAKPGDDAFARTTTRLVGTNADALDAAQLEAEWRGYDARVVSGAVTGEAREVGRRLARRALDAAPLVPTCFVWGGETTVTVTGAGRGGRNQEVALGAAQVLAGTGAAVAVLSAGTDGIDGPTDAAGAVATPATLAAARARGLCADDHLARNDAYAFFDALASASPEAPDPGGLVRTGPTHTNVMDVMLALVRPAP